MRCPACGGETPAGKRFCRHCGSSLTDACPACGGPLEPDDRYCVDCGAPVTAPMSAGSFLAGGATPAGHGPVAERRLCSVMFVDLVGSTSLAEKRDPEEIRELLSLYFERARGIVGRYGGTVEKFIGDAVMAVWGAPVAKEDDAERAVRAALDLVASVAEMGRECGLSDLAARAGVVTGEVAITIGKVSEGMVAGDTVNSASRLQSVAARGAVLVDESTWRAASGAIAFEDVGDLALKGRSEPVKAWRALRVVAQRKGVGRIEGLEAPFVGRGEELRLVNDLLQATEREHKAHLLSVTGLPGIGKTRLIWEFAKYTDGLAETTYWHEGRSPAYGDGITFWALGEMVRMRAGIGESEDAASSGAKLSACVAEFVPDQEEHRWVEARLAHLLGLGGAPPGDRNELFSAWRAFFEHISDVAPTIMVFEDLQWADAGLIDFVESILEWSSNHPILVICLARPELMQRRPTWGAGQHSFTSIHLEPLSDDEMADLLHGLVQGVPDEVLEAVRERAEGVPLYGVETVRMLVDRGALVRNDGTYSLARPLGPLDIPDTLHALIASRLDDLSTEALAAVHGGDPADLGAELHDLMRKEFLFLDTNPLSPGRGQYGFVQSLIAEVASATLSRRDRATKHLTLARHIESLGDEELTGLVAAHYVEAYRATPAPEAAELATGALEWLSRAGRRALTLGSPEQALDFYEQALAMTPAGPEHAALLEAAGEAAERATVYDRALSHLEDAIAHHEAADDTNAVGRATAELARALGGLDRYRDAIERVDRAFRALGDEGDERVRAGLACVQALAYSDSGSPESALEWSETALVLSEKLDDVALVTQGSTPGRTPCTTSGVTGRPSRLPGGTSPSPRRSVPSLNERGLGVFWAYLSSKTTLERRCPPRWRRLIWPGGLGTDASRCGSWATLQNPRSSPATGAAHFPPSPSWNSESSRRKPGGI
jgi:class 3 adenylate cyclase/tetratricopeptide (TPR) repeat protein